jgi:hypothetical protein
MPDLNVFETDDTETCSRCGCTECECYYCSRCNDVFEPERMCFECDSCRSCCRCRASLIFDYNEKAEKHFGFFPPRNSMQKPAQFLYLGVELECELKARGESENMESTVARLAACKDFAGWALCKHDGSLDMGFEVVTAPSDLPEHKKRWGAILRILRQDMSSWRRLSTGLHVHLSRSWFSALDLAKFVYFINAEENRRQIVAVAGRTSPDFGRLQKKKLDQSACVPYGRYEAVNLNNPRTIEVRMFKGTLNTQHVLADVEFCHALAHYVKQASVAACTWPPFWSYVLTHAKTYRHLVNYMNVAEPKLAAWIDEKLTRSFFEYTETQDRPQTFQALDTEREMSQITEPQYVKKGA